MRKAARAIVQKDGKLLVMQRTKHGRVYYNLIGGGVEDSESPESALHRELEEEASIIVKNPRLVFIEDSESQNGIQYVYLCEYVSGEPALHPESEEAAHHASGENLFKPMWMDFEEFKSCEFVSERLKTAVLEGLEHGFPVAVIGLQ